MHVISRKPFAEAARKYPNDADAIHRAYRILKGGQFRSPDELKRVFPTLDNFRYRDKWCVVDIGGNNLRLTAFIEFRDQRMFVKYILSHADYDKVCKKFSGRGH